MITSIPTFIVVLVIILAIVILFYLSCKMLIRGVNFVFDKLSMVHYYSKREHDYDMRFIDQIHREGLINEKEKELKKIESSLKQQQYLSQQ